MTNDQKQISEEEKLNKELEEANKKIADLTEMSKRALADLVNYKKRIEAEKENFIKYANIGLAIEILEILDNFERAFAAIPEELKQNEWVKGIIQIEKQLADIFQKHGISKMESAVGQKFDPNKHEIVSQTPGEKDVIVEEVAKGYMLYDKIIRPAKVKVGNGETMRKESIPF